MGSRLHAQCDDGVCGRVCFLEIYFETNELAAHTNGGFVHQTCFPDPPRSSEQQIGSSGQILYEEVQLRLPIPEIIASDPISQCPLYHRTSLEDRIYHNRSVGSNIVGNGSVGMEYLQKSGFVL
jgi:hypothetical protein